MNAAKQKVELHLCPSRTRWTEMCLENTFFCLYFNIALYCLNVLVQVSTKRNDKRRRSYIHSDVLCNLLCKSFLKDIYRFTVHVLSSSWSSQFNSDSSVWYWFWTFLWAREEYVSSETGFGQSFLFTILNISLFTNIQQEIQHRTNYYWKTHKSVFNCILRCPGFEA